MFSFDQHPPTAPASAANPAFPRALRLCAVSVDMDQIQHYRAIHGIQQDSTSLDLAYQCALPRWLGFAREHQLPLTLFVVGKDLEEPAVAALLQTAQRAGHEIGNHSYSHFYDFARRGRAEIRAEIARGQAAIRNAIGVTPRGFRAPGYTINEQVFEELEQAGFLYDSSVFPCPAYYAAKAAVLLKQRLSGRISTSSLDTPQVLRAPTVPYLRGTRYFQRGAGLLELPIQVSPALRLPIIGTSLSLAGANVARWLMRGLTHLPFINLEMHAIDLLAGADGLSALLPHQPDLRISYRQKLDIFGAVVQTLKHAGYTFVSLENAAQLLLTALGRGESGPA